MVVEDWPAAAGMGLGCVVDGWEVGGAEWNVDWWCGGRDFGTARAGRN